MDVNAIDLTGVAGDADARHRRSRWPRPRTSSGYAAPRPPSPTGPLDPGLDAMTAFLETKTVWHPIGV